MSGYALFRDHAQPGKTFRAYQENGVSELLYRGQVWSASCCSSWHFSKYGERFHKPPYEHSEWRCFKTRAAAVRTVLGC